MAIDNRGKALLLALVISLSVVAPVGVGVAETFLSTFYTTANNPIHHNASDGPEVVQTKDFNLRSGNPYTDKSYNLSTENNGWINVSTGDPNTACMVAEVDTISGSAGFTNVSGITASCGNITFQPDDKNFTKVKGGVTSINFTDTKVEDDEFDLRYTATSSGTIVVETNATGGTQYGLVDVDTNEGLDVAVANSDGTIVFDEVPSGTHDTRIDELGILYIREEEEPHDPVTGSTVTIRFYEQVEDDPQIVERTDSDNDGQLDLTGVQVNKQFVVEVSAPGYYNRTILIQDLSEQETAFLLNKTKTVVTDTFTITDVSGDYTPADQTSLEIEKAINRSLYSGDPPKFAWTTMSGDTLGADKSYTTDLEKDERYRIVIKNKETDSTAILGEFNAKQSENIGLTVGGGPLNLSSDGTTIEYNATKDQNNLYAGFLDPAGDTTTLKIKAYEWNNESNVLFPNQTFNNVGDVMYTHPFTGDQNETAWQVEFYWKTDGEWHNSIKIVGQGQRDVVPDELDPVIETGVGVLALLVSALIFTQLNVAAGAVITSLIGGMLWYVGLLASVTTGPAVVLAIGVSLVYSYVAEVGP